MREIERTTQFRRDYRREARGTHRATLEASLSAVLVPLMMDEALAERFRDHRSRANGPAFGTAM